jgi:hypothetical protein
LNKTLLVLVLATFGLVSCAEAPPPPAPAPAVAPATGVRATVGGIQVPCFPAGNPCAILNGVMVNNGNCCSGSCNAGVCQ